VTGKKAAQESFESQIIIVQAKANKSTLFLPDPADGEYGEPMIIVNGVVLYDPKDDGIKEVDRALAKKMEERQTN
jgi:hypothetical protein